MAVEVRNLSFSYGFDFELKGIKLKVNRGEVVTLLGPNGSGKTTLLKCICALLKPKTGVVFIDGRNVSKWTEKERAKTIGYVPQVHNPSFSYTALDFVLLGRTPYIDYFSQPSKQDCRKAEEALRLVGLYHLKDRDYTEVSGGERRLLLIARALAQEPQLLVLDEPTVHLDLRNELNVLKIIVSIVKERKICAIMSQHDPNLALRFSDLIVLLNNGQIVAVGKPKEVINEVNIARVYGVKAKIIENNGLRMVYPLCEVETLA